ncbi:MAG: hypothetical protein HGA65_11760, partial [Oscillochloris sp.]|nr:hypothetical protein [Oscillochloris sp.]
APGLVSPKATRDEEATFEPTAGTPRSEVNFALSTARSWFGTETSCYKASADQGAGVVTLRFHFPEVARERYREQLAELADFIGWAVRIWPQPHQEALMRAAREVLPPGLQPSGTPAIQSAAHEVVLRVQGEANEAERAAATRDFAERTGWSLRLLNK